MVSPWLDDSEQHNEEWALESLPWEFHCECHERTGIFTGLRPQGDCAVCRDWDMWSTRRTSNALSIQSTVSEVNAYEETTELSTLHAYEETTPGFDHRALEKGLRLHLGQQHDERVITHEDWSDEYEFEQVIALLVDEDEVPVLL